MCILYFKFYYKIYFSEIALAGFQYEPLSLSVNQVCLDKEQDIPNAREKSVRGVTDWGGCGGC